MKSILIIFGLTTTLSTHAQNNTGDPSQILVGTWVLYKESSAAGISTITSQETDTIQFSANGIYSRKYSKTIENGRWNYSPETNGIILSQRIRDYFWEGQRQSYNMPIEVFTENNNISKNEFIDTLVTEDSVYTRYYKRIN